MIQQLLKFLTFRNVRFRPISPLFCFLGWSGNETISFRSFVSLRYCQQQKLVGVWEARPVQHLSFAVQISYCKCQMLQRPRKETTGREHIIIQMYCIPAVVCGGILWHDSLPPPSPSPLFPYILSHYTTDLCVLTLYYWLLQAFCTQHYIWSSCCEMFVEENTRIC